MKIIATILIGLCLAGEPQEEPTTTYENVTGSITEVTTEEVTTEVTGNVTECGHSLGTFTITAYCGCANCCGAYAENRGEVVTGAIGEPLTANYSIAVDPNVIAFNEVVLINGKEYEAQDTGGAIKGNRIDIYFDNHEDAVNYGVQYIEVFKAVS